MISMKAPVFEALISVAIGFSFFIGTQLDYILRFIAGGVPLGMGGCARFARMPHFHK
jgi:hypothetical protein